MFLTDRIEKALLTAARLHDGQRRKESDLPYIVHPYAVAFLLAHYTDDQDIIAAGLLHDVLEDVPHYGYEDLRRDFGERVANIVREVSEDKLPPQTFPEMTREERWQKRKEDYINNLKNDSEEALLVAAADKICNLRSLLSDYKMSGENLWKEFQDQKRTKLWFYRTVHDVIKERIKHPLVEELERMLAESKKTFQF